MQRPHLSALHDHGLPAEVDWPVVAAQVARLAQQMSYPPFQLAIVAPSGEVRAWYLGSEKTVGLPHVRDLGLLYQAIVVLEYPTGISPSFSAVVTPSALPRRSSFSFQATRRTWSTCGTARPLGWLRNSCSKRQR